MRPYKAARIRVTKVRGVSADVWKITLPACPERGLPERFFIMLGHFGALRVADALAREPRTEAMIYWRDTATGQEVPSRLISSGVSS